MKSFSALLLLAGATGSRAKSPKHLGGRRLA
jgi:hypothetical protein